MTIQEVPQGRLRSPFYPRQADLDRLFQWHDWKGYASAEGFYDTTLEYFSVRNSAGVFDLTPMTKYRITGPDSLVYINRLVTRDMSKIKPGRVAYAVWCDDEGQVIDDGTIFHLKQGEYRLCSQERHMAWLQMSAIGMDVTIVDETEEVCGLALQGPTSCSILKAMGIEGIENLRPFGMATYAFQDTEIMISRTGFTGDLGYEVWLSNDKALDLWDAMFDAGKIYGIMAMGTEALEHARIEAGFIAAYVDFLPANVTVRTGRSRSPFELGLDWLVDFKKPNFNGRRALAREKRNGSTWQLVKLDIEGNKPAHHSYIYSTSKGKKDVGFITSAAWSPVCKQNVALGTVRSPHGKVGEKLYVEIYYQREMHWSKMMAEATVVDKPFWDPPRKRATPPGPF
ncbi:MAG: aminomethyltransferase family protein [Woeseiaceae bacterium]|jgi:aminomethyltransferase|nr:aminomethyltransferase family protein [Woeseiaceae bacterium]|tara:strand:+ start:47 stop:1240 length:1194 start_codon:yes stop_codon:yes gene_type:complete